MHYGGFGGGLSTRLADARWKMHYGKSVQTEFLAMSEVGGLKRGGLTRFVCNFIVTQTAESEYAFLRRNPETQSSLMPRCVSSSLMLGELDLPAAPLSLTVAVDGQCASWRRSWTHIQPYCLLASSQLQRGNRDVGKGSFLSITKTRPRDRRHFINGLGIHQQVVSEVGVSLLSVKS